MDNQLVQVGVGSTDWNGGKGPAGGSHTGTSTIVMQDGTTFVVAHNAAEVQRKRDLHGIAQTAPSWVAFDVPGTSVPVVLNLNLIFSVR